jgi:hypothetical protein
MDLPCFGSKLKGDYSPPFTCGSDTRRSIIKYFVRDYINQGSAAGNLAEQLVRDRIKKLIAAWSDVSKFSCRCPDNGNVHSLDCCKTISSAADNGGQKCFCLDGYTESIECCENNNNFNPPALQELFDEIPAEDVVAKIIDQIDPFLRKIFTEPGNYAFKSRNNKDTLPTWNWARSGVAESATKVSGLFSSTDPIMSYNETEVGYPFKDEKTIWQTCEGMLRQASFLFAIHPKSLFYHTAGILQKLPVFLMHYPAYQNIPGNSLC